MSIMQFNVKWRFLVHKRLQIQLTHLRLWCEIKAIVKTTKTVQISFHVEYPWAISVTQQLKCRSMSVLQIQWTCNHGCKKCKQTTASNKFLLVLCHTESATILKLFSSLWLSLSSSDLIYLYALSNFETLLFNGRLRVAVWMTKILGFHAGKLSDLLYAVYKCL